ncbi:nucleotidyl transferase AbiEii/AbiGii toxin family protein [Herbidospora mongoliensis]|uniref:nucleotidyl transferase AbiEii/AbiGii toxin family protein n=1 Tax=Herbidospora mongoliensis TaxID=688067 RepID=UPI0034E2D795
MVFRSFYFSRLAARVFHHDPQGWLIKGGQALLLRYPAAARLSRDIDLQFPSAKDTGEAREALLAAARMDLGDFFEFIPTSYSEHADEIGGAKQSFDVTLGTRRLDSVAVDFVTGRHPTSVPEVVPLSAGIAMPWPTDWTSPACADVDRCPRPRLPPRRSSRLCSVGPTPVSGIPQLLGGRLRTSSGSGVPGGPLCRIWRGVRPGRWRTGTPGTGGR